MNAPNNDSGVVCADVAHVLFSGWNEKLVVSNYKMKTISSTTDWPFHLNVKSAAWTDLTVGPTIISYLDDKNATRRNQSVEIWLKMKLEGFNKESGVQHEPRGGFTAHFTVCIYITTILNKHLPANNCVLNYEAHTHLSSFPWKPPVRDAFNTLGPCCFVRQKL